jgi:diguanylate cyclase (GGDEF)-like protein
MRVTRRVLLSGEPQVLDPAHDDIDPLEAERLRLLGGSAALLVPLVAAGRVVGLVEFIDRREPSALRSSELALMRTMANQAATALENARLMRELRDAAETDLVTGVYSHRHLQDRLRQETARAARSHDPLSVVMVDLDDFKLVNDAHGHQAGDRVLRAIAGCLRASVRAGDVVARYGGDEFVVLMPDTAEREAQAVARRAAEAVAALRHPMADGTQIRVTCSVGLALHPRDGRSGRALLRAADAQMYEQKRTRSPAVGTAPRQADQATHLEREAVAVAGAVATAAIPVAAVPEGAVGRAPR